MYLRRITEEEGLVIITKTRIDSGVRAELLPPSAIGSHSYLLALKAQKRNMNQWDYLFTNEPCSLYMHFWSSEQFSFAASQPCDWTTGPTAFILLCYWLLYKYSHSAFVCLLEDAGFHRRPFKPSSGDFKNPVNAASKLSLADCGTVFSLSYCWLQRKMCWRHFTHHTCPVYTQMLFLSSQWLWQSYDVCRNLW